MNLKSKAVYPLPPETSGDKGRESYQRTAR